MHRQIVSWRVFRTIDLVQSLHPWHAPAGERSIVSTRIFIFVLTLSAVGTSRAVAQLPVVVPFPPVGYFGHGAATIRTHVTPLETQVFIDGFLAGIADDFDGVFQRLPLVPRQHVISFYLPGYRTYTENAYLSSNRTRDIRLTMVPRPAGEPDTGPPMRALPLYGRMGNPGPLSTSGPPRFGALWLGLQPEDATVTIDGVPLTAGRGSPLPDHVAAQLAEGRHRLQIEKTGFEPFAVDVEIRGGETTGLNVALVERATK